MFICGLEFPVYDGVCKCALEQHLPPNILMYPLPDGALYAAPAKIGTEPHPLIYFSEAAIYRDGAWIVGIDRLQNRCFTPVFAEEQ